ncbi:MAG TPA: biotin/lipoyl-containing protein [Nitrospinota bacterium]|nr:biotin/lipoyl-containing protein [Nitrospinota bacterium]HJN01598.1 biotin/lipoyl-containing protein [Nitrospinota bacterium]
MSKIVKFMCTAFRDGFQSAYGARVLTEDFIPAVKAARDAGITYFEAGGGARFQSLYFYCNQDAFTMMDIFRKTVGPDANLQTLARGVNVVGLESQSSEIIRLHAKLFKKHGITTIRNFDALNDVDNLIHSGQSIVDAGLKHQVCVTLMELPPGCDGAHDPDFYEATLRKILDAEIPFDGVCFKDASGTLVPSKVYETIKRARKMLPANTHIHFHTHETAGIGVIANKAALEGGADAIDLSMAPCSGGTCQPDIIVMWHALRGTDYKLDVDIDKVLKAEEVFKDCMKNYFLPPEATAVEPLIPWSPMPGGALTANTQMLRDNGIMDKYSEIIKAMGEVVEKGGYGTSVTPVSQFYFQQAFNNVMFGPWEKIAEPYGKMVLGYFGKTPVSPDPEVVKIASEQLKLEKNSTPPIQLNDADPEKSIKRIKEKLRSQKIEETDENIFIVATCGEKGTKYLKGEGEVGVRKNKEETTALADPGSVGSYLVTVNGREHSMVIEGDKATVNGKVYEVTIRTDKNGKAIETAAKTTTAETTEIIAQMPGKIMRILHKEGDVVKTGESILVIESMKMEVQITSTVSGKLSKIAVSEGEQVTTGQLLATVN